MHFENGVRMPSRSAFIFARAYEEGKDSVVTNMIDITQDTTLVFNRIGASMKSTMSIYRYDYHSGWECAYQDSADPQYRRSSIALPVKAGEIYYAVLKRTDSEVQMERLYLYCRDDDETAADE